MNTKPTDYPALSAYITVKDAAKAIEFYKAAFGAEELFHLKMGDVIGHAELWIGGTLLMLSEEFPGMNKSPLTLGDTQNATRILTSQVSSFTRAQAAFEGQSQLWNQVRQGSSAERARTNFHWRLS